ncbi:hypothetical protein QYE76_014544 [Lolium multiflorum]|uniref:Uncharacterized protein n=1 Tax=Lolium multiflorum TaxID=4521 RepID=A0AAD8X897_LOLMU|nr:hypothetical protein QYE76_014544 [Lolium multiflorum]
MHLLRHGFMPSYNCWTKHGERGVIMEEDEEGDDFIDESYLAHFGDTFMEDAEGEGEGEEEARDDPVDDLGRTIADARRRCETEKERENLDRMLEDHRKALYPGCDDGLKKLGCTLDFLKWKAQAGKRNIVGVEDKTDMSEDYNMFAEIPPFKVNTDPSIKLNDEDAPWIRHNRALLDAAALDGKLTRADARCCRHTPTPSSAADAKLVRRRRPPPRAPLPRPSLTSIARATLPCPRLGADAPSTRCSPALRRRRHTPRRRAGGYAVDPECGQREGGRGDPR